MVLEKRFPGFDRRLNETDVHPIASELENIYQVVAEIDKLAGCLKLSPAQIEEIKRQGTLTNYCLIKYTLIKWISTFGNTCTFSNLAECLRSSMFITAAEAIENIESRHLQKPVAVGELSSTGVRDLIPVQPETDADGNETVKSGSAENIRRRHTQFSKTAAVGKSFSAGSKNLKYAEKRSELLTAEKEDAVFCPDRSRHVEFIERNLSTLQETYLTYLIFNRFEKDGIITGDENKSLWKLTDAHVVTLQFYTIMKRKEELNFQNLILLLLGEFSNRQPNEVKEILRKY